MNTLNGICEKHLSHHLRFLQHLKCSLYFKETSVQHFSLSTLTNGKNADKWFPLCNNMLLQYTHVFAQVVWVAIIPYQDFCKTEKFGNTENEKM